MYLQTPTIPEEELQTLLQDLQDKYGYDFTNYSQASLKRRIASLFIKDKITGFTELRYRLLSDKYYLLRFVQHITVNVTEMFRDPPFYKTLRQEILPVIASKPLIRIWHAGCSTGEEVYSMAILLKENNLLHKSLLYATDINPLVIEKMRSGMFPISQVKLYSDNYNQSGGAGELSSYYTAQYDWAKFSQQLSSKIIMATHNLVSDRSFNEFQLIICRNVLIYFNKQLQQHVFDLFDKSLETLGYLALGSKETLRYSPLNNRYVQSDNKEKIWRKMK